MAVEINEVSCGFRNSNAIFGRDLRIILKSRPKIAFLAVEFFSFEKWL